MQSRFLGGMLLAVMMLSGCVSMYDRKADGIVVHPAHGHDVALRVVDQSIIRVTAGPGAVNIPETGLVLVDSVFADAPVFEVEEGRDAIFLRTPRLEAAVALMSGEVSFRDAAGNVLLQEPSGGGKHFEQATVMDEKTWHIRQVFESPEDEAFYGLGQHQNGLMNYKGHRIDLKQYNLIAAVPFLVSSRNYGLLWNNTSRTIFGDPRDYRPLPDSLTLYDADGNKGGLSAEYFQAGAAYTSRVENVISYESLYDQEAYPVGFTPKGSARIEWSGFIEPKVSGAHSFRLYASSYVKLWIDGRLLVDSWRQDWCPWERIVNISLKKGTRHSIRLEWIPDTGYLSLTHLAPMPEGEKGQLSLSSEVGDAIDYCFVYGRTADEIISGYRTLTGPAPMMPKWAMGMWQCRERYKTQDELLGVVREFRRRSIPLDNIVQDWNYWPEDRWGDHDFDPARFPDPDGMIDELHNELNAHIMISVWPKFYVGTEHYNQFAENGWLYMRNVEKQERDWIGEGYVSTFYDPYSAGARKLFWAQIENKLFSKGIDAWWLDATEPDIHSNLPDDEYMKRIGPTAMGSSARYRNTFSLMNATGIYEGQRKSAPDQRVFILTRSAFAGQQRCSAATWSGDIATTWYDLKTQIACGLNFCLSGIPYWTMDIGGFAVEPRFFRNVSEEDLEEWRELQTRWFQFGTFCPIFRVHGQYPFREMYNIAPADHPAYQSMVEYDRLRYRLMPYIYSLTGHVTHDDYTIMRALMMDFSNDANVREIDDQFMFGPALMVCPVTEYKARERSVYLPSGGDWYAWQSGERYAGGQTVTADAPYSDIPLFVRAGSIIPCGPDIQYTGEKSDEPVRLMVFTGSDGVFSLYEDEGTNYNYESGAYSRIPLLYSESAQALIIGARSGSFAGMPETRTFEVVWIDAETGIPAEGKTVIYKGKQIVLSRGE